MSIEDLEQDVTRLTLEDGKRVTLVGTAHISQQSVDVVRQIIASSQPDTVCVELDEERFRAVREQPNWEELDLKQVIRNKQLVFLMARLALGAFQKRMGSYTGVKPGAEMIAAIEAAEANQMEVVLCDRNVRTTLMRAWRETPFWRRSLVAFSLLFGLFERTEVNEEELNELRKEHNLSTMLDEMGEAMPEVKTVLVDERDSFMAEQIRRAAGEHVVVIIGAAHKPGITRKLVEERLTPAQLEAIDTVPPRSPLSKLLPWALPLIVIALFVAGFLRGDTEEAKQALWAWVLANGIFSALGAALALGHPAAILTAFIAAPITSINPTVGAGMFAALAQVWAAPPTVRDMEHAGDDIVEWKGWWTNRLTRLLLVFMLSSLGSSLGTIVSLGFFKGLLY